MYDVKLESVLDIHCIRALFSMIQLGARESDDPNTAGTLRD